MHRLTFDESQLLAPIGCDSAIHGLRHEVDSLRMQMLEPRDDRVALWPGASKHDLTLTRRIASPTTFKPYFGLHRHSVASMHQPRRGSFCRSTFLTFSALGGH